MKIILYSWVIAVEYVILAIFASPNSWSSIIQISDDIPLRRKRNYLWTTQSENLWSDPKYHNNNFLFATHHRLPCFSGSTTSLFEIASSSKQFKTIVRNINNFEMSEDDVFLTTKSSAPLRAVDSGSILIVHSALLSCSCNMITGKVFSVFSCEVIPS